MNIKISRRITSEQRSPSEEMYGLKEIWSDAHNVAAETRGARIRQYLDRSLSAVLSAPFTFFSTLLTVSISLFLFAMFLFALELFRDAVSASDSQMRMSAYLTGEVTSIEVADLKNQIENQDGISGIEYLSSQDAFANFKNTLGQDATVLEGLDPNSALPASLEITFKVDEHVDARMSQIAQLLRGSSLVERVMYGQELVDGVRRALEGYRFSAILGAIVLVIVTGVLIGNAIELALYAHREEIEIMRLVGAQDSFIEMPYLIEGFVQGFSGALIALFFTKFATWIFADVISKSDVLTLIVPEISGLSWLSGFIVILVGISVGTLGSFVSVRRYLKV